MARIVCILGLLLFTLCAVENTEIEEGIENLQLRQDGLTSLSKFPDSLESAKKQDLRGLLHELSKSENEVLYHDSRDNERQEKNRRGTKIGLTTRKACRGFFWKSFVSC